MLKKVLKLSFENDYNFLVTGIICAYKDFKLCFELNELLKIDFTRKKDVMVPAGKPGANTRHSYFSSPGRNGETYHLISNRDKDGTGFFIPEIKNMDFFLLVSEIPAQFDMNRFLKKIKTIEIVSGAFEYNPSEVRSADAFLLILEA